MEGSAQVLVTRAEAEARKTAAELADAGFEPVIAPLRTVEICPVAWPEPPPAMLVATSRNAFSAPEAFPAAWRALPIHCVGEKTAQAARQAGFRAVIAAGGDADALCAMIGARWPAGVTGAYLAGEPRLPLVERRLGQAGIRLATLVMYRMDNAAGLPEPARACLAGGNCAAVTHFSAESVRALFRLAAKAGLAEQAGRPIQACLSAPIADIARRLAGPGAEIVVADARSSAALVEALRRRLK